MIDGAIEDFYKASVAITRRDVVKIIKLADRFNFPNEGLRFINAIDYAQQRTMYFKTICRIIAFIVINIIEND
jgi:hypothetical protein